MPVRGSAHRVWEQGSEKHPSPFIVVNHWLIKKGALLIQCRVISRASFVCCGVKERDEFLLYHQNEILSWLKTCFPNTLVCRSSNRGTGKAGCYTGQQAGMCKVCVQNISALAARFTDMKETWWPLLLLSLRERTREQLLLLEFVPCIFLSASPLLLSFHCQKWASLEQQGQAGSLQLRSSGYLLPCCHGQGETWPASFPPYLYLIWGASPWCGEGRSYLKVLAIYLLYNLLVESVI